jgi:hypothetical protein
VVLAGCTELTRTNPIDSQAPVDIVIEVDRDTLHYVGQTVTFAASAGAEYPNPPITWSYLGIANGTQPTMIGTGPTLEVPWQLDGPAIDDQGRLRVTAWIGTHATTRAITLSQRFGGIRFTACTVVCLAFTDAGSQPRTIFYSLVDCGGTAMSNGHPTTPDEVAVASQVISRDPAVVSVVSQSVYSDRYVNTSGGQRGSTWLVFTSNAHHDSILVYADLRPQSVQLDCPASVAAGSSAPISGTAVGVGGVPLVAPVTVRWTVSPASRAYVSDGRIQGVEAGAATVSAFDNVVGAFNSCVVTVTP